MDRELRISFANRIEEVRKLPQFLTEVESFFNISVPKGIMINLALEEAVANVIKYAYPPGVGGEITLSASYDSDSCNLVFVLSDKGQMFDPTKAESTDTHLSAHERLIGGLGIIIYSHIMDTIKYQYIDDTNHLTMEKKIEPRKISQSESI